MKRPIHFYTTFLLLLHLPFVAIAQTDTMNKPRGSDHAVIVEIHIPVAAFASSHIVGGGLEYSWSHHRYGINASSSKSPGILFAGGGTYFIGKKETVAANDFHFGGYIHLHALAGMIYNPSANTNVSIAAGPALGLYKENSEIGWAIKLAGNYYLKDRIAVGPAVMYRKQKATEALWTAIVRATYTFGKLHLL
jgi:hypothetical protein